RNIVKPINQGGSMILNCPQCGSRFLVADALIPKAGRTVRCGSCAHEWLAERAADAPEPEAVEPSPIIPPADKDAAATAPDADAEDTAAAKDGDAPRPAPKRRNVPALAPKAVPLRPFLIAAP